MEGLKYIKFTRLIIVVLILSVISVSCDSGMNENPKQPQLLEINDCSQSKTQPVMDDCREKSYKKVQLKLSTIVKKLSKSYSVNEPKLEPVLKVSQQQWNEFINAECEFSSYYSRGGAGYNGYFLGCLELKTLKRIQYLENVLKNP